MTYAIQDLAIRDVAPADADEITDLVAAAMWDGPVARWMHPDPAVRRRNCPAYSEIVVEHAVRYGEVYATVDDDSGRLTGVALWFPPTSTVPSMKYQQRRHPLEPHYYLAFLVVHPDSRCRGVGSALLERHHARLDRAGIPSYLEASHPRNRDLFLRHGYRVRSVIELPDGPPLWTMWRWPVV